MVSDIFVNLPVKDLARAQTFFRALGFTFDPRFTDDQAACLVLGAHIYAMLLAEPFFQTFTPKAISDAHRSTEVLTALAVESRAAVDTLVSRAVAAGGRIPRDPQDDGFMYGHAFEDLDGHIWEVLYMAPEAVTPE